MSFQAIHDIAEICVQLNVTDAILSPGSRCAPLTLSFARHPEIRTRIIPDERSAGFVALGIAQAQKRTVVTVCTSGTAVLNYGPAIAEAYYQRIPLVMLTADRPPELIDQQDGQTIRQKNVFSNHVKKSMQLPDRYDVEGSDHEIYQLVSYAIKIASEYPAGPVHVNVPIREPFYPGPDEQQKYTSGLSQYADKKKIESPEEIDWADLKKEYEQYEKVLILIGQQDQDLAELAGIAKKVPIVTDILSNAHKHPETIRHADEFLKTNGHSEDLQPDLLISLGMSTISKNLKLWLRKFKPKSHWHIQPKGSVADTYQSVTRIIRTTEDIFLKRLSDWSLHSDQFVKTWHDLEIQTEKSINKVLDRIDFCELAATNHIIKNIKGPANLHLSNSMPVRLANRIGLGESQSSLTINSNRGTSGIDGCTSTAVGNAMVSEKSVFLLTGDMAFFYDRNAFWHNYKLPNLKIVVLNNHAGGIFGLIDGPNKQPELEEYFETYQGLKAENLARDHGLKYLFSNDMQSLDSVLDSFFAPSDTATILEVETDNQLNKQIFKQVNRELDQLILKETR